MGQNTVKAFLLVSLILTSLTGLVVWDLCRVNRDFQKLTAFLSNTRMRALEEKKTLLVQFTGQTITIKDMRAN